MKFTNIIPYILFTVSTAVSASPVSLAARCLTTTAPSSNILLRRGVTRQWWLTLGEHPTDCLSSEIEDCLCKVYISRLSYFLNEMIYPDYLDLQFRLERLIRSEELAGWDLIKEYESFKKVLHTEVRKMDENKQTDIQLMSMFDCNTYTHWREMLDSAKKVETAFKRVMDAQDESGLVQDKKLEKLYVNKGDQALTFDLNYFAQKYLKLDHPSRPAVPAS